jgi:hypothetical protein
VSTKLRLLAIEQALPYDEPDLFNQVEAPLRQVGTT